LMMMVSCFMKTSSSSDGRLLRADETDKDLIHDLLNDLCTIYHVQLIRQNISTTWTAVL